MLRETRGGKDDACDGNAAIDSSRWGNRRQGLPFRPLHTHLNADIHSNGDGCCGRGCFGCGTSCVAWDAGLRGDKQDGCPIQIVALHAGSSISASVGHDARSRGCGHVAAHDFIKARIHRNAIEGAKDSAAKISIRRRRLA